MDKIRKGDEVVVIAGRDKGRRGVVSVRVDDSHVIIEGLNQVKKHVKPNPAKNEVGGVVAKSMPLHASNIALYNPETQKADRVGFKLLDDGAKARFFKSSGKLVGA